ncbi:MAG: bis(5'-nucleosyl)-tetraphosphatase (symmetrical) YqeK [Erysipelotrichaceae bacterium]|nr:bis(5'-nucleosyl)-tetraphosphatase (symmetrical) YqeK [Erysipelotrichaceae bacterium]
MKRTGIYCGSFDPITVGHLESARRFIKKNDIGTLYFLIDEKTANADRINRYCLIKKATSFFRHMNVADSIEDFKGISAVRLDEGDEDRKRSAEVRKGDFRILPECLRRDVIESGIYADSIVRNSVNDHRYRHSVSVADLCCRLAEAHHLDSHKAFLIGIYHDIAKGMSDQQMEEYMKVWKPYEYAYPAAVWHAYVGAYLLTHDYGMKDEVMLKAIRHHCLGDHGDPYSKIVYIADKLDPSRGYDSSREIDLALRDLDSAFALVHLQQAEFLAGKEEK